MRFYSLTQQHLLRHPEKLSRFKYVRIWSREHVAWWRPNGEGYAHDFPNAGIFEINDAWKKVKHYGPEKGIVLYAASEEERE